MKLRIDELLVKNNLVETKREALGYIMGGSVYIDEEKIYTAGERVDEDSNIWIKREGSEYVSRGGDKLEKAIELYDLDLKNKVIMDIGSSTGGFTDCMLKNGASKVYALDVGYGQLDWKLRNDDRVVVMERTNIRDVTLDSLGEELDFASIDVSFISLELVLPVLKEILKPEGRAVALIKPQFEAKREDVGDKGVIRDKNIHTKVLKHVSEYIYNLGFTLEEVTYSPITGATGNIEYLGLLKHGDEKMDPEEIERVVDESHRTLIGRK